MTGPAIARTEEHSVESVVRHHLCVGCGTCILACSENALQIVQTPAGLVEAHVDSSRCKGCSSCLEVCPGRGHELCLEEDVDPAQGPVITAWRGAAASPDTRARGQSGGVVTALLEYLTASRTVDSALVTTMPADGTLQVAASCVSQADSLRAAAGSKYCPVPVNASLVERCEGTRTAVVALGCHTQGIRLAERAGYLDPKSVTVVIGLVCDRVLLHSAIQLMCLDAGVRYGDVLSLDYRSKESRGLRGNVLFSLRSGEKVSMPSSLRIDAKEVMTPTRCRMCLDKLNVFSDIVVGDPWGVPVPAPEGESVLLVRTERGRQVVDAAVAAGELILEPLDPSRVFEGQEVTTRRANVMAAQAAWRLLGGRIPAPHGEDEMHSESLFTTLKMYVYLRLGLRLARSSTTHEAIRRATHQRRWIRRLRRLEALASSAARRMPRRARSAR
jgi:coenzyme F420 hydrogenase subunit beta